MSEWKKPEININKFDEEEILTSAPFPITGTYVDVKGSQKSFLSSWLDN